MKYKVVFANSACRDLETIKSYIANDNPAIAKQYVEKIINKLETLESFPLIGKPISNSLFDYAKCFYLPCMNYVAIYQVNEVAKCVYIVRILSHFQNWKEIVNKNIISRKSVLIANERLSIACMDTSMYYDVWQNSLDENNRKFVPDEVFETLEEASEVVNFIIESYNNEDGPFIYSVIRNSDQANLGYVQLVKIEEGWEVGYHIAKKYCGNGYATEALSLFVQYLKQEGKHKEIYGVALASNKASRRVLEKNGFELYFEGRGIYQGKPRKIIKTIKKL